MYGCKFTVSGHLGQPVLAGGKGHDAGQGPVLSVTLPVSLSPLLSELVRAKARSYALTEAMDSLST